MKSRRIGKTGIKASEIGTGCWAIGGPFINLGISGGWGDVNEKDAKEGLIKAIELGSNIFDTADVYGYGNSERLLGWLLKNGGIKREDIFLITKTGYFPGCAPHGFDPLHMNHQIEMSLKNLGTKYIDIYFFHHLDFGTDNKYLKGAIGKMKEFKEKGMINNIGLRGPHDFSLYRGEKGNFDGKYESFLKLVEAIEPEVVSIRYNMISPTFDKKESDIFKWAKKEGIGLVTYKPLAQGLLLNKYDPQNPPRFQVGDHRLRKRWFSKEGLTTINRRLETLRERFGIKDTKGFVQLAIKYCLSRDSESIVFVGFKNKKQISESLTIKGYLNESEMKFIRKTFEGINEEIGNFTDFKREEKQISSNIL